MAPIAARPRSGDADHGRRRDRASLGAHRSDISIIDVDPRDRALGGDTDTHGPGGIRVAEHDCVGSGVSVAHADRGCQHIIDVGQSRQSPGLGSRHHPAGHPHRVLQSRVLFEHGNVGGVGEQEQVADLLQADISARSFTETLESVHRPQCEGDVDLVGELQPHSAGRLRGRTARQLIRLEQQHVGQTGFSEMERRAGAHHTPTDDHHFGTIRNQSIGRHTVSECDRSARSDTTRRRHNHASLRRFVDFRPASRAS